MPDANASDGTTADRTCRSAAVNGSGSAINLASSNAVVQVYLNGSMTPGTPINLTGTVAAGATYVLAHSSAPTALRPRIDAWLSEHGLAPVVAAEFDDSALLKAFGREGRGVFAAPAVVNFFQRQYAAAWPSRRGSAPPNSIFLLRSYCTACTPPKNASQSPLTAILWPIFSSAFLVLIEIRPSRL